MSISFVLVILAAVDEYVSFLSIFIWAASPVVGQSPYFSWINIDENGNLQYQITIQGNRVRVFNTLRPRQNGCLFADATFKRIFLNENVRISIKISLKFFPKVPIHNIPALFQIMAWRRPGDKPLSETMMVILLTHICVTRPQWVNSRNGLYWERKRMLALQWHT